MKVLPFKIPKSFADTLIVEEEKTLAFYDKLHQHEEIQLSYIVAGKGTFIVGDAIKNYEPNDILIFGSNVPHVLISDKDSIKKSYMISLFFTTKSFGDVFFDLPEFKKTKSFLSAAQLGIKLSGCKGELKDKFRNIKEQDKLTRFISFLSILNLLIESEYETVASFVTKKIYSDDGGKRMSAIFELILNNYHRNILLSEAATIISMTPNAFCRYFKQHTGKAFIQFLTEVRIENSCKLLSNNKQLSISEIAEECGLKNISNYNRKFKLIKKMTPTSYRKKMEG